MAFTPTAGMHAVLSLKLASDASYTTIPAVNWKFNIDAKTRDVSNFRDGRFRKATLEDSTISLQVIHDAGAPEYLALSGSPGGYSLVHGNTGIAKLYVDDTHFYQVSVVVAQVGPENEGVEGVVVVDVTLEQSGSSITYPTG